MTQVPIAEGIFTWPSDDPRLLGARCGDCGTHTFPAQSGCPRCGSEVMPIVELAERGTLFTFTTQEFLPKEPYAGPETDDDFDGFAVGYVELPGQVIVESRLVGCAPERLRIGMPVRLVVVPFRLEPDGREIMTFAFAPVDDERDVG
jgi:uncharacterized OB-fold protein